MKKYRVSVDQIARFVTGEADPEVSEDSVRVVFGEMGKVEGLTFYVEKP